MSTRRTRVMTIALMFAATSSLGTLGCQKQYKCPETKDTSQTQKWKELGFNLDAPDIQICEASEQNFSAVYPSPPSPTKAARALELSIQVLGYRPTPSPTYVRKNEDDSISRRFNLCDPPQNPLGVVYVYCSKQIDFQIDALPDTYKNKPFLVWGEFREGLHDRYDLSP